MTWGSRLGFKNEKVLILHADDAGSNSYINTAIFESLKQGIIQSCSVLVKDYPDKFLFKIRDYDFDVGLHFDATDLNCSRQIDAQFKYMVKKGVVPTHIDSHRGSIFLYPQITKIYINYANDRNVPILAPDRREETIARFTSIGLNLSGFDDYEGLEVDDFYVLSMLGGESFEEKKHNLLMLLDNIKSGITHIVLHISSNLDCRKWHWEWKLFEDNEVLDKLNSFTLTNWKEIWHRYGSSCNL